ncbi:uncharacterized protein EV420DRAFT_15662 [Desarmillaria tabescens]|uniref:Uncharacterized protein n=1 Tax=Armillaria tabescens TaxID=1929756 RepID=A0AA39T766_ARMTA|nr:uncharacterized protein EV420DRAFT_15662 [Desarmillaria tabescens]KAK0469226.1 hypothetical protein EV420DRAFT_15662 [Desarmillaria tabescens]
MTLELPLPGRCLSDGSASIAPAVAAEEELNQEESQQALAIKLGWNIQASKKEITFIYGPAVDEACAELLDEGSRRIVEHLSPFLLGAQTLERSVFIVGLTVQHKISAINNPGVVVILVDSLQPLLHAGPPDLPHGIGHHVYVVQRAMTSELAPGARSSYSSADDALSPMPWVGADVVPGRAIYDLPLSQTAAEQSRVHRSSIGLVLSIPPNSADHEQANGNPLQTPLYALTCGYNIPSERAVPISTQRRSRHLYNHHIVAKHRDTTKRILRDQGLQIDRGILNGLRAARGDESKRQRVLVREATQRERTIFPLQDALAVHEAILSNPCGDTEYCIGEVVVAENTTVVDNPGTYARASCRLSSKHASSEQVRPTPTCSTPSSASQHTSPRYAMNMDWSLVELTTDLATNTVGHQ